MPERNGKRIGKRNGARKLSEADRLVLELEKVNTRITEHTEWLRGLSNDLRRLGEKLYGITEGTVTLADVKLPIGRYRTPDQSALASSDFASAAERMTQVRRRFVGMEKDLAAADHLRMKLEKKAAQRERRKAS
jgi:hypothetical protein